MYTLTGFYTLTVTYTSSSYGKEHFPMVQWSEKIGIVVKSGSQATV